jgi:hypothetical protein
MPPKTMAPSRPLPTGKASAHCFAGSENQSVRLSASIGGSAICGPVAGAARSRVPKLVRNPLKAATNPLRVSLELIFCFSGQCLFYAHSFEWFERAMPT